MKWSARIAVIVFMILWSSLALSSQKLIDLPKHQYQYGPVIYNYQDMDDVFRLNDVAYPYFVKAKKNLRSSRTNGFITLGAMAAGTLVFVIDSNSRRSCSGFCITTGQAIGIVTWITVVPIMGTISLIQLGVGRSNQRKSVMLFNEEEVGIKQSLQPRIEMGLSEYGLGLVMKF